jgi:predicted transcriptional regulator
MASGYARLGHIQRLPVRGLFALILLLMMLVSFSPFAAAFPSNVEVDAEVAGPGSGPVIVADLDNDGWNDILRVDEQGNITVHFQDPLDQDFPFEDTASMDSSVTEGMEVGLLDPDGRLDVASFTSNSLVLNFQYPARKFVKNEIALSFTPNAIEIGDMNGDAGEDIVLVGDQEVLVLFRNSAFPDFYGLTDVFWNMTGGDDVALGHFGGSIGLDIAVSTPSELHIFIQGPQGLALNQTVPLEGNYTSSSVGAGDFNSDIRDDIVVLRSNNGNDEVIEIFGWEQDGGFGSLQSIENDDFGDQFSVGDLNDDGLSDIAVVADEGDAGVLLYLQRELTRSEFSYFSLGNFSAPGGTIAVGELNWDPYTDIVLRTTDKMHLFFQDDFPPFSANQIPSRMYFNENTVADNFIKLDDYIRDDHTTLQYAVIYESNPDLLHAIVDGIYLDFIPKEDWVGTAKFQVAGWQGDYIVHSNKFIVGVNDVPDVLSPPKTRAKVGQEYSYHITVEDTFPTDDRVRFNLVWGPKDMEINPYTGMLTWIPERPGGYKVAVIIEDQYGGRVEHSFVVNVAGEDEFPTTLVAGGVGILTIILIIGAFLFWNENALFAFFLLIVPLYTKLKREKILDHFVRGKIYGYILANPGEHYNAIREVLGLTNGSLAHHLRTLERENFIKSKKFGIYRRFYPMKMRMPEDEFEINEIQKMIMAIIKKSPGISQKEIASDIKLTPPTVNYHIGILLHEGLVRVARKGRRTACYLDL